MRFTSDLRYDAQELRAFRMPWGVTRLLLVPIHTSAVTIGEGNTWAERMARNAARRRGLRNDAMED